jgi:hypothetical protein
MDTDTRKMKAQSLAELVTIFRVKAVGSLGDRLRSRCISGVASSEELILCSQHVRTPDHPGPSRSRAQPRSPLAGRDEEIAHECNAS